MRPDRPGRLPAVAGTLATPSLWLLFCCALSALVILWLPLALLQEVDALLAFSVPKDLLRDVALLLPMVALLAVALPVPLPRLSRVAQSRCHRVGHHSMACDRPVPVTEQVAALQAALGRCGKRGSDVDDAPDAGGAQCRFEQVTVRPFTLARCL